MQLQDKVAIVTGGASGMGRAISLGYAREGAHVVIADVNETGAKSVADEVRELGVNAIGIQFDVRSPDESRALVARTTEELGSLDILVNNAGVGLIKEFWDTTPDEWDRIFDVNVRGLYFLTQAAADPMRQQHSGRIINLASIAGRRGEALVSAYCASKATVISITQSVAMALAPYGVNVNAMAPGVVDTPYWEEVDRQFGEILGKEPGQHIRDVEQSIPLGRVEQAEDVVPLAVFLAGDGASYITGQTYNVEGGMVMS